MQRRTGRSRVTLALLVLTSLAVLRIDFRDTGIVEGARRAASTVFSPFRGVARTVSSPFENAWNGVTDYGDLEQENDELRERLAELEGQESSVSELRAENEILRQQLELPVASDVQRVVAEVIAGPPSNFTHTVEISKGTADGIQEGMPVLFGAALAGQVVQATSGSATVQLITDPDFAVGVRNLELGLSGTARGRGEGADLVVDTGSAASTEVPADAVLVTSGIDDSRFPAQIPVGTVRRAEAADGGLTLDLIVEPLVDTNKLAIVTVLLWEPAAT
jgi:rod shape-determining protein MreC